MNEYWDRFKHRLRKIFSRKRAKRYAVYVGIIIVLCLFRFKIMNGMGQFLIVEDTPDTVEVIFVLGGNSEERGEGAAAFYEMGYATKFVTTGENVPSIMTYYDLEHTEAEITRDIMVHNGIPIEFTDVLISGTSTQEEALAISEYCDDHNLTNVMILSDHFHTRRINYVFRTVLENQGVNLLVCGVSDKDYTEDLWWESEAGLLMVNNEYVKLMYYMLK